MAVLGMGALACDPPGNPRPRNVYEFIEQTGGIPVHQVPATWQALPYSRIELDRLVGSFFESQGPYFASIVLQRGGAAELNGTLADGREGRFTGEASIFDYVRLCQLLDEVDVGSFEADYRVDARHQEILILRVFRGQGMRPVEVREYGKAGPASLWALHAAIDSIAHGITWTSVPDESRAE